MDKTQKIACVETLNSEFRKLKNAILIDYRGLNVVGATGLRREIQEISSRYIVVKNTLALRAAKETDLEVLSEFFKGPTAIAYNDSDAVPLTKLLLGFAKNNPSLTFKAGLVEGKPVSVEQLDRISKLPGRTELLSQVLYLMKAPLSNLAGVLRAPIRDLAAVLKQVPKSM